MPQPTPIALDSSALKEVFRHYGSQVLECVNLGRLKVYVPVIVYAEQAIYPGWPIEDVCEALGAQVAPLLLGHARRLGQVWQDLPDPFQQMHKKELWKQHKFDLLIATSALEEGWVLVTKDKGPAFQMPGLQALTVAEFVNSYLQEEKL